MIFTRKIKILGVLIVVFFVNNENLIIIVNIKFKNGEKRFHGKKLLI